MVGGSLELRRFRRLIFNPRPFFRRHAEGSGGWADGSGRVKRKSFFQAGYGESEEWRSWAKEAFELKATPIPLPPPPTHDGPD